MSDPPSAVTIRPYEERDRRAVQELFVRINRELAPEHLRGQFEDYIRRSLAKEIDVIADYYGARDGGFWVANDGRAGALIGMFGLERVDADTAELRRMYVAPQARRRGIARMMLAHAEEVCGDRGYRRLVLSTSELQQAALALYRAADFRFVREETAAGQTNKTVGAGLRRFHFEKELDRPPRDVPFCRPM